MHLDLPSVRFDNRLDDCQPHAGTSYFVAAGFVSAIEAVEIQIRLAVVFEYIST